MRVSGIYSRLVRYMAYLYRYDWEIIPYAPEKKNLQQKVLDGFYKASRFFENSNLKKMFGHIALAVVRDGSYYGYYSHDWCLCPISGANVVDWNQAYVVFEEAESTYDADEEDEFIRSREEDDCDNDILMEIVGLK